MQKDVEPGSQLVVARREATKLLEPVKEALDEVARSGNPDAEIVVEEYPMFGAADYIASINKILAATPDFGYSILFGSDPITFTTQALGFFDQINRRILSLYDSNMLAALGEENAIGTEGVQRAPFAEILKTAEGKSYVHAYREAAGRFPSDWAMLGYECMMVWAQAAKKANSFDVGPPIEAIEKTRFNLPRGNFVFGKHDHQLDAPIYIGNVVKSETFGQPIVEVTDVVPGAEVRRSKEELDRLRAN